MLARPNSPLLALVIPCYNEEETLPITIETLDNLLNDCKSKNLISQDSFVLYVNDGSHDNTWNLLEEAHKKNIYCRAISFATNAGHQNAVWAGMDIARTLNVDCIISLDADLQDDISVIPQMIQKYNEGCDIVYGVRNDRSTDTSFKRGTAHMFYKLMQKLNVQLIPDHADYRLVAKKVLDILPKYNEQTLFLRGLFPTLGFTTGKVFYARKKREAGESKYPIFKMISFAWKGITSCSAAPLRIAGFMSLICMITALGYTIVSLYKYLSGETIQGWTSMIIVVLLIGAVQLFCLSIMGEYLAKVFTEVRHRPRYIIEKIL